MSIFTKYLLAGTAGAAAASTVVLLLPAGATTLAALSASCIIAGSMITSAHIIGEAMQNTRNRRNRRPWLRDQEPNHLGVRPSGGRRIDPS